MFLFAVTRRGLGNPAELPELKGLKEFTAGGWTVSVVTDGWLSSAAQDAAGQVVLRGCAPFPRGCENLTLAEARFSPGGTNGAAGPAIEILKALVSGRQVYYHAGADGSFYCATHARLLRSAGVRLEEDAERLPEVYLYRYVTPPRTLFRNIDQLVAGESLRFEFDGRQWRSKSRDLYAPPGPLPSADGPPQGADRRYGTFGERNAAALRDSITALAPSSDRPHVLLSGGLDSSILFQIARDELGVSDSHSTSYPFHSQLEAEDLEREYALSAAEAMGANHQFFAPTLEDFLRGVVETIAAAEEPIVHLQSVLMMLLFRDGLPPGRGTVIVGQGADGAYGLRLHGKIQRLEARAAKYRSWGPLLTFGPALGALQLAAATTGRAAGLVEALRMRWRPEDPVDGPNHVLWWLGAAGDPKWIGRSLNATVEQANANRAAAIKPYQGRSAQDLVSLLDFVGDVSITQSVWSKAGEAAGKWVYYPFNYQPVLDAAFETPWDVKLAEPKGVLRGVARRVGVPEFIITRPKANFSAVTKAWAVPGGVLEPLVPLAAKVFGEKQVRSVQSEEGPRAFTFWTMLNLAIWRRLFIEGESLSSLLGEIEAPAAAQPVHA